ncbi:hydroxymethylglutaryl-CoA lyase [Azovibrio restrictus]|uniref:hydroxymethylglutaryl-CoA lyase n=1 Tax=Azovibrio restrictus TaxID=146938 RepID=UPI0026EA590D|nr:hydroxymethylglutaryl-CoA lyase [Azovibrio restrictus]MDD3482806.1 hydroxymethylglutaryl-CoA lyase [Azovibrio restrictus]
MTPPLQARFPHLPARVQLVEVSPRDGLQNIAQAIPTSTKVELIERLADAGLTRIEAAAFVSPRWVPQMADGTAVLQGLRPRPGVRYPVLVPNLKGFDTALEAGATEVAIFTAASEEFSRRNTNASICESLKRLAPVVAAAQGLEIPVRGYVSCVAGCPYQGEVTPEAVAAVAGELLELGCYEISLGDTIGVGTPGSILPMLDACARRVPLSRLAGHYHDTRGMAVANIYASLEFGLSIFDTAVAGLGGCPYAPGAAGNVATEDVLYLLQGLGVETGVDMEKLLAAGQFITTQLGRESASRVARSQASGGTTCQ